MYLPDFDYHQPVSIAEASQLLVEHGEDSRLVAGGTELVLLMKLGLAAPKHVVSLGRINGLGEIALVDGVLHIGALVTHEQVAGSHLVRRVCPPLAVLESQVANPRVRNTGTLVGNLCFAEPRSDPPTLLLALDSSVSLSDADGGQRTTPLREFFVGPYQTILKPTEVVTGLRIPVGEAVPVAAFERVTHGAERPILNAAAHLDGDSRLTLVIGAITDTFYSRELDSPAPDAIQTAGLEFVSQIAHDIPLAHVFRDDEDYYRHLIRLIGSRLMTSVAAQFQKEASV